MNDERAKALDALIEAVEAGKWPDDAATAFLDDDADASTDWGHWIMKAQSLDAALSLHDALLSKDTHWSVCEDDDLGYVARVFLYDWHRGIAENPARAWLLAILRAHKGASSTDEPR